MVTHLIEYYWEVCKLKRSPADTPYSKNLLVVFSLLYFVLIQFQWHFQKLPPNLEVSNPIITGILLLSANLIFMAVLLSLTKKANRFVQSTTTLMAVHSYMHVLLLPLIVLMTQIIPMPIDNQTPVEPSTSQLLMIILVGLISLLVTIWQLVIIIFVVRKSLDTDTLSAVLATFGLLAFTNLFASYIGGIL